MIKFAKRAAALAVIYSVMGAPVADAQVAYGGAGRVNSVGQTLVSTTGIIPTYSAAGTFAATTGVLFYVCGSSTATVVLRSLQISGTGSSVGTQVMNLIKTSTAPSGGTPVSITPTPFDSNNAAATATAAAYTAAPTGGTSVGNVGTFSFTFPTPTGTNGAGGIIPPLIVTPQGSQPLILRGATQCVELQTSSSAVSGESLSVTATWTEESFFPGP